MFDFFTSQSSWIILLAGVAAGFVLIIFGGDFFVDSAVWLAKITHIPQMIIGATVVSIGTTLPEIFVSFTAAAQGRTAMAAGNAAGSIFCNLALILGITLAFKTAAVDKREFLPKFIIFALSSIVLFVFALNKKNRNSRKRRSYRYFPCFYDRQRRKRKAENERIRRHGIGRSNREFRRRR